MQNVYLDNAATTALRPEVIDKMTAALRDNFGNASSTHSFGRSSKSLIEQCRKTIASYFNVSAAEIIFTSGGTEADNLALRSAVRDLGVVEIITSRIEHHAILHTAEQLRKEYDIRINYVNLQPNGIVDYTHLETLLQNDSKKLVSLMHINNEVGNILDLQRVSDLCVANNALFHSDTVQSVGHYLIDLSTVKLDFLAASAHKFHGPKGVGFCFIRKESGLKPLIFGGEQERGYRAGTESIHNIVGMDEALKLAYTNLDTEKQYIKELKHYFITQLNDKLPGCHFSGASGDLDLSTYTLLNVSLPFATEKAAMLQFQLDLKGIACSKGSACQSGSTMQSHVLTEVLPINLLNKPSVRFSMSIYNTKADIDYVVDTLCAFAKA
ncbi:cysteine desulfurase family protein [Winogradskyella immobilis]|uniref:cysteine desulfurase n=1 Tax=Winogradskyella immobilis TaxID=2816852 RepID=A0ABS8EKJ4_9FLAO|nr:cysteine desulfurase family protein [Winogradskyella immobilis]MCC1483723.1 cysteine desulfurase [Winogradskyella immobilis]MCG0015817.1 cysteine desulfurase [Winogradskyella immobilis]